MSPKLAQTKVVGPHLISLVIACATILVYSSVAGAQSLPELKNELARVKNISDDEARAFLVWRTNCETIYEILRNYSPASCTELQARISDGGRPIRTRLLYAGILALEGDGHGQEFLLREGSSASKVREAQDVFWVIGHLSLLLSPEKQKTTTIDMRWAEDFMLQMLKDDTELDPRPYRYGRKRCSLAMDRFCGGNFFEILAKMKSTKVYPILVESARLGSSDAIMGLEELGDQRAVPLLLDILAEHDQNRTYCSAGSALAKFGCRDAVPILLQHLGDEYTYGPLRLFKDERILPAIKKALPQLEDRAKDEARLLIIDLEGGDRLPKLMQLAKERDFHAQSEVLWKIERMRDERAIPFATEELRTSPDICDRIFAITLLGNFKSPQAIKPLIDALDIDYQALAKGKDVGQDNNKMCREMIAESLNRMTGKDFGVDKAKWLAWYAQTYK